MGGLWEIQFPCIYFILIFIVHLLKKYIWEYEINCLKNFQNAVNEAQRETKIGFNIKIGGKKSGNDFYFPSWLVFF